MNKPVKPATHSVIDYVFSGLLLTAPSLIAMNQKAKNTYRALGIGFLAVDAFTDTPAGIKRAISFKTHQKLDLSFLTKLSLLTAFKLVRKDKKALRFHLAFFGLALAHYILTDYKAGSTR